jgi:hypothetical protein
VSISCDCSVDNGDGDYPSFFREETPIAKKAYKCYECRSKIEPGQKYHKAFGVWDGVFSTYRTCWTCNSIRLDYCPNGVAFGELAEAIQNCLGFDYRTVPDDD